MFIGPMRECESEFGPHDDHKECAYILFNMSDTSYSEYLDWERESYNRELEAESLGRPLFPNEY
jgi:hypothetical protein